MCSLVSACPIAVSRVTIDLLLGLRVMVLIGSDDSVVNEMEGEDND